MAKEIDVIVNRPLVGDKRYKRGDERTLTEADAQRLAATGAVTIKKDEPSSNKMAKAPKNKSSKD